MILIAAMGANRVIGSGAGMPWHVPAEYAHFLATVRGQSLIMGRRSWEIFGADLKETRNIVVSRSVAAIPGVRVVAGIDEAVRLAEQAGTRVFSAGGAQIYAQTLPLADELYLSIIKGEFEGDAYFPEFDPDDWVVTRRDDHADFEFVIYRRKG